MDGLPFDESSAYPFGIVFAVIIAALGIVLLLMVLASYVLSAIGLYTMAKKRGLSDKAFWAWIPIGNCYLMGLLARDTSLIFGTKTYLKMHILYPVAVGAAECFSLLVGGIILAANNPMAGVLMNLVTSVAALGVSVLGLVCFYGLIKGYDTKNSVATHTVLAAVIPLYQSILIFVFRNRPFIGLMPSAAAPTPTAIEPPAPPVPDEPSADR